MKVDSMILISTDDFFRALCDETRRRCLALMVVEGESCVCELTHALDLSQPKISRHLAALKKSGLVLDRREGQWVYYRLNPNIPQWMTASVTNMVKSIKSEAPYQDDATRLEQMANRPTRCC